MRIPEVTVSSRGEASGTALVCGCNTAGDEPCCGLLDAGVKASEPGEDVGKVSVLIFSGASEIKAIQANLS